MPQFQNFTAEDRIIETTVVTKGFFTGDIGTVAGTSIVTSSITGSQQEYYSNLSYNSVDHFSVAFGHKPGSGSDDTIPQTKAIYQQMANYLLLPDDIEINGFQFDGSTTENEVYFLIANRSRMKDRINRKNWTIHLSGSHSSSKAKNNTTVDDGGHLYLTDDSETVAAVPTPVGPRYNVVSGTLGTAKVTAATTTYGWFYPDMGIWALSGTKLSASLPGTNNVHIDGHTTGSGFPFSPAAAEGIGFALDVNTAAQNHMKLVGAISASATGITMRNEERQITTSYFVRAKAGHWNSSNNPTFSSESNQDNSYSVKEFIGNPQTFITTVGLYSGNNKLVAVGRLSSPINKSYSKEAFIKVKLVY